MKSHSMPLKLLIFVILTAVLAACGSPVSEETDLLVDANLKYSVSYPSNFNVETYGTNGVAILRGTRDNYDGARADINLLPTGSLDTQGAVDEWLADYPNEEIVRTDITLDTEPAVQLDGIPGKEITRLVLIIHGDALYKLNFAPGDPKDNDYREMEALYKVMIESFEFDPEP